MTDKFSMTDMWEEKEVNRKSRKVTCADLVRNAKTDCGFCKATADRIEKPDAQDLIGGEDYVFLGDGYYLAKKCINVSVDTCRMKPVDVTTGKPLKRKFTANTKNEKIPAKWW